MAEDREVQAQWCRNSKKGMVNMVGGKRKLFMYVILFNPQRILKEINLAKLISQIACKSLESYTQKGQS